MEIIGKNIESSNREFYEEYGDDYENFQYYFRNMYEQQSWNDEVESIIGLKGNRVKVLDIGCGTGNLTLKFLERGAEVTALDISAKMLNILKKKAVSRGYNSLTTVESPLSKFLEKEKSKYDVICESSVLHHLDDYMDAVIGMAKRVKPGGYLYLTREPKAKFDFERRTHLSKIFNFLYHFITSKYLKVFEPRSSQKWRNKKIDHSFIARHAYEDGVSHRKILSELEGMGFSLFSLRFFNRRPFTTISHLENITFSKLRMDEFRRTFWSLILQKNRQ